VKFSNKRCTALATAAAATAGVGVTVVLPHSRKMELEADFIGMHLMASSCYYDPRETITVLTR
jgi:predicted Zn-dependent protease